MSCGMHCGTCSLYDLSALAQFDGNVWRLYVQTSLLIKVGVDDTTVCCLIYLWLNLYVCITGNDRTRLRKSTFRNCGMFPLLLLLACWQCLYWVWRCVRFGESIWIKCWKICCELTCLVSDSRSRRCWVLKVNVQFRFGRGVRFGQWLICR